MWQFLIQLKQSANKMGKTKPGIVLGTMEVSMLVPNKDYVVHVRELCFDLLVCWSKKAHLVWSGPLRQLGARRDDPAWPLLLLWLLHQWWHRLQRGGHCLHVHRGAGMKERLKRCPFLPLGLSFTPYILASSGPNTARMKLGMNFAQISSLVSRRQSSATLVLGKGRHQWPPRYSQKDLKSVIQSTNLTN